MKQAMIGLYIVLIPIGDGFSPGSRICAQTVEGPCNTVQGNALRGRERYLRGLAWYELGAAQARAIEVETMRAWNQAVRADYEQYLINRAQRLVAKKASRDERAQAGAERLEALRRRWRENPTVEDLRSGIALNALASDLAAPAIPPARWQEAPIALPDGLTIESLAFRFTDAPKVGTRSGPLMGTVAVGRMKGEKWPVTLRRTDLASQRESYRHAVARVIAACRAGEPLQAPQVDAVRDSLFALKDKALDVVPTEGGQKKQASAYLVQLDEATRVFLDREFAEELIRDVEQHKAKTVGELLGFMRKYRLLFDEGDDNPEVWSTYRTVYDLLKQQAAALEVDAVVEER